MKTLLTGGARSGKSGLAARWAEGRAPRVTALVTATAGDAEMQARIDAHKRSRPPHWRVVEAPLQLGRAVRACASDELILIDCLTLWGANALWPSAAAAADWTGWQRERLDFLRALGEHSGEMLIVSNEVGSGIVPDNAAARIFRDEQGWLNQSVAQLCDEVFLVVAGLPLRLKPNV